MQQDSIDLALAMADQEDGHSVGISQKVRLCARSATTNEETKGSLEKEDDNMGNACRVR